MVPKSVILEICPMCGKAFNFHQLSELELCLNVARRREAQAKEAAIIREQREHAIITIKAYAAEIARLTT